MVAPKIGHKRFVCDIPVNLHRRLKVFAVSESRSMREIVLSLVKSMLDTLKVK